mmetsp:Transcript_31422/g.35735  ORF Transcript_31422/g.35735 Transcript_31422/m.35735 type:complete len:359 (+) Transcript_31422:61-1137(+)
MAEPSAIKMVHCLYIRQEEPKENEKKQRDAKHNFFKNNIVHRTQFDGKVIRYDSIQGYLDRSDTSNRQIVLWSVESKLDSDQLEKLKNADRSRIARILVHLSAPDKSEYLADFFNDFYEPLMDERTTFMFDLPSLCEAGIALMENIPEQAALMRTLGREFYHTSEVKEVIIKLQKVVNENQSPGPDSELGGREIQAKPGGSMGNIEHYSPTDPSRHVNERVSTGGSTDDENQVVDTLGAMTFLNTKQEEEGDEDIEAFKLFTNVKLTKNAIELLEKAKSEGKELQLKDRSIECWDSLEMARKEQAPDGSNYILCFNSFDEDLMFRKSEESWNLTNPSFTVESYSAADRYIEVRVSETE